jgi:hypothetical protein
LAASNHIDIDNLLGALPPAAAGFVLGIALGGASADEFAPAGALVQGAHGEACRAALRALGALPREQRAQSLAQLAGAANRAIPAGVERIHPGWLRAALDGEATAILLALVAGLPAEVVAVADEIVEARDEDPSLRAPAELEAEALAELRRALFAAFAPMPDPAAAARSDAPADAPEWRRLAALSPAALLDRLARTGAELLGASLHGAPPVVIARAAAGAGEAAGATVLASATGAVSPAQREHARSLVAAAAPLCQESSALGLAQAIGLIALAEMLAQQEADAAPVLAQRLPPAIGQLLLQARPRVPC